jgi:hypothetical protein
LIAETTTTRRGTFMRRALALILTGVLLITIAMILRGC